MTFFQDLLLVRARAQAARRGGLDLDAAFVKATNGLGLEQYLRLPSSTARPSWACTTSRRSSGYREILGQYEKRHNNPDIASLCAEQFVGTIDWYRERFAA
jgi:hypothetical protein